MGLIGSRIIGGGIGLGGAAGVSGTITGLSPTHYWPMDDPSGSPQDNVGTNHLTVEGTASLTYEVTGFDGESAITFPGSDDTDAFTGSSVGMSAGDFSLLCFVRFETGGLTNSKFFASWTPTSGTPNDEDEGRIGSGGGLNLEDETAVSWEIGNAVVHSGNISASDDTVPLEEGTWRMMLLVRDGSTVTLYIDDQSFELNAAFAGTSAVDHTLAFGAYKDLPGSRVISEANVTMQHCALWLGTALSATDAADLFEASGL